MTDALPVDPAALREEVKTKYGAVALDPQDTFHFHTGRPLARRLGYDAERSSALAVSCKDGCPLTEPQRIWITDRLTCVQREKPNIVSRSKPCPSPPGRAGKTPNH